MKAGPLRNFVTVDELIVELDSDGAQIESWAPVFDGQYLSAEIAPLSGRELIAAQATQSKVSTRIVMRYRPGFKASMRLTHRDTIYNIESVVPDPISGLGWVTLMCSSGVNEG